MHLSRKKCAFSDGVSINKRPWYKIIHDYVDEIYTCYHSQSENCKCRKPKNYFFKEASRKYDIDFENSYMIGDRKSDIDAGNSVNCKTIFIDRSYSEIQPNNQNFNINVEYFLILF